LAAFDEFLALRGWVARTLVAQLFGALYVVCVILLSAAMLLYWVYCAQRLLSTVDGELTGRDIEDFRWDKRLREQLHQLFFLNRFTLN
jgi:hypothetical protein